MSFFLIPLALALSDQFLVCVTEKVLVDGACFAIVVHTSVEFLSFRGKDTGSFVLDFVNNLP